MSPMSIDRNSNEKDLNLLLAQKEKELIQAKEELEIAKYIFNKFRSSNGDNAFNAALYLNALDKVEIAEQALKLARYALEDPRFIQKKEKELEHNLEKLTSVKMSLENKIHEVNHRIIDLERQTAERIAHINETQGSLQKNQYLCEQANQKYDHSRPAEKYIPKDKTDKYKKNFFLNFPFLSAKLKASVAANKTAQKQQPRDAKVIANPKTEKSFLASHRTAATSTPVTEQKTFFAPHRGK